MTNTAFFRTLAVAALSFSGGAVVASEDASLLPYENDAAVTLGATLYSENCASCHGVRLQGEPDWRTRDADGYLPAPPHDVTGHTWHHPDEQLFAITKYGVAALVGNGYQSRMPGFEGVLSDAEIVAILAFIKSTWPEQVIDRHNEINQMARN